MCVSMQSIKVCCFFCRIHSSVEYMTSEYFYTGARKREPTENQLDAIRHLERISMKCPFLFTLIFLEVSTHAKRRTASSAASVKKSYVAKNFVRHLTNFRRSVLGCIDSYDSESRRIFQHFSRSTRFAFLCTAQISKFQQKTS